MQRDSRLDSIGSNKHIDFGEDNNNNNNNYNIFIYTRASKKAKHLC